eukprot:TRINITY_DN32590_c0_g1_i1.p1 TRINITY_DN32590_c0_g1~~TRINITY_DN32590_c0_g1_i1.p1  ORF type:complete len:673 (+),score=114.40 TRINITY_DN32590_c0_g1_i1:104-2122(+)
MASTGSCCAYLRDLRVPGGVESSYSNLPTNLGCAFIYSAARSKRKGLVLPRCAARWCMLDSYKGRAKTFPVLTEAEPDHQSHPQRVPRAAASFSSSLLLENMASTLETESPSQELQQVQRIPQGDQGRGNNCHICAAITATSVDGMLTDMADAKAQGATCVEFRIDYLKNFCSELHLAPLIDGRTLPAIVTFRPTWDGGLFDGPEGVRLQALRKAMELGADFVDIELQAAEEFLSNRPVSNPNPPPQTLSFQPSSPRIIVSSQNNQGTPSLEELQQLATRIQALGDDVIVKIATAANDITDVSRMLDLIEQAALAGTPMVGLTMGLKGQIGRLLCPKYGAFLTFGALAAGKESADGQPTVSQLANIYRVGRIGPATKVFGLIGNPVAQSKGYILHNELFHASGCDAIYVPFLVDDVPAFLKTFSSKGFAGFSVTIPHKQVALDCCQHVDEVVKSIGACNTLVRRPDGSFEGHNTDWDAAISAIEDGLREREGIAPAGDGSSPLAGRLVVVVGAGGAGRALAFGAKQRGGHVAVANRSIEKARELAAAVGGEVIPLADLAKGAVVTALAEKVHGGPGFPVPVLANSTSVGMVPKPEETPVPEEGLAGGVYSVVFDAVYAPLETRLLREAAAAGAKPVSGLEMFIRQAAKQYQLFTGLPDPRGLAEEIMTRGMK